MHIDRFSETEHIKNGSIDVREKEWWGSVPAHNHSFYELEIFLTDGGGYIIDGKEYAIEKGSLFFLSPAAFHKCEFPKGTRLFNIMFTLKLADISLLYRIFSDKPYFSKKIPLGEEFDFFKSICSLMVRYTEERRPMTFVAPLLNSLLGRIYFLGEPEKEVFDDISPIQRTVLYIQANFNSDITLDDAAAVAEMSRGYFCDRFHAVTGTTFKRYLLDMRFSYAKKLLKYTDLSVTEIAFESGFNDFSHFMYMFKKHFSVTPRGYRIENSENG